VSGREPFKICQQSQQRAAISPYSSARSSSGHLFTLPHELNALILTNKKILLIKSFV
jgi:hypothetical protein